MKERSSIYNSSEINFKFEKSHFDLVKRISRSIIHKLPSHICFEDILQSGMIGLIEAANRFDSEKGVLFTTYATIRIRGAIMDDLRKSGWTPRSVQKNAKEISAAVNKIEMEKGRSPKQSEIANLLNMNIGDFHGLLNDVNAMQLASYDDSDLFVSSDSFFENPIEYAKQENVRDILREEIYKLPDRERVVLLLYYINEMNLKEIGEILGVSESRVSQIHHLATDCLNQRIKEQFDFNDIN